MANGPRCVLLMKGTEIKLTTTDGAPVAEAKGTTCPHCGEPLRVHGDGARPGGHDYYTCDGYCAACRKRVGELRAYVSTIFGVEEDDRVLHGRCRVY